jgi:anti-anti-sigma factor
MIPGGYRHVRCRGWGLAAESWWDMPDMPETVDGTVPVVEVIVTEELDSRSVPRLTAILGEALELHPARLVVDLAECPRIDAAAVGLLVDTHRRVRLGGGLLTLRSPSARLRRILQLARADRVLHVTAPAAPGTPDTVPAPSSATTTPHTAEESTHGRS